VLMYIKWYISLGCLVFLTLLRRIVPGVCPFDQCILAQLKLILSFKENKLLNIVFQIFHVAPCTVYVRPMTNRPMFFWSYLTLHCNYTEIRLLDRFTKGNSSAWVDWSGETIKDLDYLEKYVSLKGVISS